MQLQIPYGGAWVDVEFPERTEILEPKPYSVLNDDVIRHRLTEAFKKYEKQFDDKIITIIVNDATRRIPTSRILEVLLELIPLSRLEFLIATGTHRSPTEKDLDVIFGPLKNRLAGKIFAHDCRHENSLVDLGYTSSGTPVIISKRLADAKCLICVNSVEPHFFAGFSGGRKSLIPGLAGFTTTVLNHSNANNPVHLDLEEAIGFIKDKPTLSVQLVTSRQNDIVGIFCGGLQESFAEAVQCARDVYTVDIQTKYDLLFAIGESPLDINLYQLQKAQEHGAEAVSDGGILVVVGACNDGIGSDFFVKLADDYPTPESALSPKAMADNRFGIHKLVKTARRLQKMKIWYVTKLDDKVIRKVYYEPKKSLQAALTDALHILGQRARVGILKDACFFVPVLRST
jgi:nickel-dependent lactate racemase